jgi:AAA15 family ATPase/GTPase
MEKLNIINFGPISKAEIEIKDINVYIGTTSSGKSTVAKLVSIFRNESLYKATTINQFNKLLADYNIDFNIIVNTVIRYDNFDFFYEVKGGKVNSNFSVGKSPKTFNPIYIPAERLFFPTISKSIFGLMSNNVSLPKWFIEFGAEFEKARNSVKKFSIDFLNVSYEFRESQDYVKLENDTIVRLSQASSGLQSVIPLILVVQYNTTSEGASKDMFVIEEPELNLYPSSQKDLIEFIVRAINESNDKLIITTHSPYLLTSLDNLIQARNTAEANQSRKDQIRKLIPENIWLQYDRISCYYFSNGTCRSTLDEENQSIGPSNIDDVSIELSGTFEKLLELKYPADELH